MTTKWADIKRRPRDPEAAAMAAGKAPTLLVNVIKDGDLWAINVPQWDLYTQAESYEQVELMVRDLIGISVGMVFTYDAEDAAEAEASA